jgi:hypothetical protein
MIGVLTARVRSSRTQLRFGRSLLSPGFGVQTNWRIEGISSVREGEEDRNRHNRTPAVGTSAIPDYSKGPACSFLASLNTGTCYLSLGLTESRILLPSRMVSI